MSVRRDRCLVWAPLQRACRGREFLLVDFSHSRPPHCSPSHLQAQIECEACLCPKHSKRSSRAIYWRKSYVFAPPKSKDKADNSFNSINAIQFISIQFKPIKLFEIYPIYFNLIAFNNNSILRLFQGGRALSGRVWGIESIREEDNNAIVVIITHILMSTPVADGSVSF